MLWMHDNARPHAATLTTQFFDGHHLQRVKQSPYSPDLNQCDKWLNKAMKKETKKSVYNDADEVAEACR